MEYPKYKYHKDHAPVVVQSDEEEFNLGLEWVNSPADLGIETHPGHKIVQESVEFKEEVKHHDEPGEDE